MPSRAVGIGKITEGKKMTLQTMAQKVAHSQDFDVLWDQVDSVERLEDEGCDLYIYPDGSQLKVSSAGTEIVESPLEPIS